MTLLLVLPFKYDPVLEVRALVPNLALAPARRDAIRTALNLEISLANYGDICGDAQGVCSAQITKQSMFLVSDSGADSVRCAMLNTTCVVTYACAACRLTQDTPSVTFQFAQPLSFATVINWRLTLTTGVQLVSVRNQTQTFVAGGQLSQVSGQLAPASNLVFRGAAPHTVAIRLTNSIFDSGTCLARQSYHQ